MIRLGMPCSELAIAWFAFHAGFIAWAWTQVNLFLPGCWALQRLRVTTWQGLRRLRRGRCQSTTPWPPGTWFQRL